MAILTKIEFRDLLLEARQQDFKADATLEEINEGVVNGWCCQWPDCRYEDYGCGSRYGCSIASAVIRDER